jgi:hypothetical protein
MSKLNTGEVENPKIIKAGCGTRYDPEQIGDSTGFDFSSAPTLAGHLDEVLQQDNDKNKKKKKLYKQGANHDPKHEPN